MNCSLFRHLLYIFMLVIFFFICFSLLFILIMHKEIKILILSYRMFAPKCAACGHAITPVEVSIVHTQLNILFTYVEICI